MRSFRHFTSSSRLLASHYEALEIPRNATRNQIKSSFYKLSKLYHPDVTQEPKGKVKFQAISEAYAVLGDERQRRAYDRSITEQAPYPKPSYGAAYETRRNRGATYAWENSRSGYYHQGHTWRPPPPPPPHSRSHPHPHPYHYQRPPDPFSSPNVQRATGRRAQPGPMSDADRVAGVSGFWRAVQVFGLVVFLASVGGGMNVEA